MCPATVDARPTAVSRSDPCGPRRPTDRPTVEHRGMRFAVPPVPRTSQSGIDGHFFFSFSSSLFFPPSPSSCPSLARAFPHRDKRRLRPRSVSIVRDRVHTHTHTRAHGFGAQRSRAPQRRDGRTGCTSTRRPAAKQRSRRPNVFLAPVPDYVHTAHDRNVRGSVHFFPSSFPLLAWRPANRIRTDVWCGACECARTSRIVRVPLLSLSFVLVQHRSVRGPPCSDGCAHSTCDFASTVRAYRVVLTRPSVPQQRSFGSGSIKPYVSTGFFFFFSSVHLIQASGSRVAKMNINSHLDRITINGMRVHEHNGSRKTTRVHGNATIIPQPAPKRDLSGKVHVDARGTAG